MFDSLHTWKGAYWNPQTMESSTGFSYNLTHYFVGTGIDVLLNLQTILNFKVDLPFRFMEEFSSSLTTAITESDSNISSQTSQTIKPLKTVSDYMKEGEIDITLGFFYFLPTRLKAANILIPLSDEVFEVYLRQPDRADFQNPFDNQISPGVASLFFAMLIVSAVILSISSAFKSCDSSAEISETFYSQTLKRLLDGFNDAFNWGLASGCQQHGPVLNSKAWEAKLTMFLVALLSYFIHSIYCALLIASLTKTTIPVKSVKDLSRYEYSIFAFESVRDRLLIGDQDKSFWSPPSPPKSDKETQTFKQHMELESMKRILTHRHAHVDTYDNFFPTLKTTPLYHKLCQKLSVLEYEGGSIPSGMFVRKNFPYRSNFNYAIIRLRECGVNRRMQQRYKTIFKQQSCQMSKWTKIKSYQDDLGIGHTAIIFIYLGACYMIASIFLGLETFLSIKYSGI